MRLFHLCQLDGWNDGNESEEFLRTIHIPVIDDTPAAAVQMEFRKGFWDLLETALKQNSPNTSVGVERNKSPFIKRRYSIICGFYKNFVVYHSKTWAPITRFQHEMTTNGRCSSFFCPDSLVKCIMSTLFLGEQ